MDPNTPLTKTLADILNYAGTRPYLGSLAKTATALTGNQSPAMPPQNFQNLFLNLLGEKGQSEAQHAAIHEAKLQFMQNPSFELLQEMKRQMGVPESQLQLESAVYQGLKQRLASPEVLAGITAPTVAPGAPNASGVADQLGQAAGITPAPWWK